MDLPAGWISQFAAVVAQNEQERLLEALLNDVAIGSAINIDPRLAPRIVMTELQRRRATERMPKHSEPLDVQAARKFAGGISGVQLLQLAHHKRRIAGPHRQQSVDQAAGLVGWQILGIVRW